MSQNSDQETLRPSLNHSHSRKLEITDAQSVIGWLHICKGDWMLYTSFGQTDSFLLISGRQSQKCIVRLFQQHDFKVKEHLELNWSVFIPDSSPTRKTWSIIKEETQERTPGTAKQVKSSSKNGETLCFSCCNRVLHFDKFAPIFLFFLK